MIRPISFLAATLCALLLSACSTTEVADTGGSAPAASTPNGGIEPPAIAAPTLDVATFEKPGFLVEIEDGRVWARRPDQVKSAVCVTWLQALPGNVTLRAPDADTALAYLAAREGFEVQIDDGRIWVLREGQVPGPIRVTRVNAGPRGRTLMAVDRETLDAYLGGS